MAYVIDKEGCISIAVEEDGEYWTGSYKHPIGEDGCRIATDEEVAADEARRKAEHEELMSFEKSFGITDHGPNGRRKQPEAYARLDAAYARGERP